MIFAQHLDQRWQRRNPAPRKAGKRIVHRRAVDLFHCHHANLGRSLGLPHDLITNFSQPTAIATRGTSTRKKSCHSNRRELYLPPYGIGVGDVTARSASVDAPAVDVDSHVFSAGAAAGMMPDGAAGYSGGQLRPQPQRQEYQPDGGNEGERSWSEELLGYSARVLALSVHSRKRELLCDRKDPYVHLTPKKLAFTVLKSGCIVAAPMLNEVILENLEEDDQRSSSGGSHRGRGGGGRGSSGFGYSFGGMSAYVDSSGRLVFDREDDDDDEEEEEDSFDDVMRSVRKSFKNFPALTLRRVLHSVMAVSTQRLLEWQAVVHLSARTADRLTKNISLSALRKTKRMSRGMAAAKMTLTAGRAFLFQNLALFIVDELFLSCCLYLRERGRRKQNPYACSDWQTVLREMKQKSMGNAMFALGIWVAGTLGTVVGTMVYPARGPEILSLLAEMGASHVLG